MQGVNPGVENDACWIPGLSDASKVEALAVNMRARSMLFAGNIPEFAAAILRGTRRFGLYARFFLHSFIASTSSAPVML